MDLEKFPQFKPGKLQTFLLFSGLILVLFLTQFLYTQQSLDQIRLEELGESVRNVFWLDEKTVYDGTSSNIGWYGTLLITYKFFGFDIHTAKYVRIFMHIFFFLIPLAILLIRTLNPGLAALTLLLIGISPTLLYFNTLQTSFGLDLQYLPLCILIIVTLNPLKKFTCIVLSFLLWVIAMVATMSYPPFILYMPFLALMHIWFVKEKGITPSFAGILLIISVFACFVPMIAAFFYLRDFSLLINDPNTGNGIFRGGGGLVFSISNFTTSLQRMLLDLFSKGESYYFEVRGVEFSNPLSMLAVIVTLATSFFVAIKKRQFRIPLAMALALILLNVLVPNFSKGLPGLRRCTGALVGFYCILIFLMKYSFEPNCSRKIFKYGVLLVTLVLLANHLSVFKSNLSDLSRPSLFRNTTWFAIETTPRKSLRHWLNQNDPPGSKLFLNYVDCIEHQNSTAFACRYEDIYAAFLGYQRWNNLDEGKVFGYDLKSDSFIPLSTTLWETGFYWH